MNRWGKSTYSTHPDEGIRVSRWKLTQRWIRRRRFGISLTIAVTLALCYLLSQRPKTKRRIAPRMEEVVGGPKNGLTIEDKQFVLDGRPLRILSGSIHYFRVPRAYWKDRLLKLKAAGLNTVDTYVAWNLHEEQRGQYDFSGNLDVVEFVTVARDLGLYVLLRPGPYICAEWEWGGLPAWLLSDPNMKIRTLYEGFTGPVESFFAQLFRRLAPLQYTKSKGGPIIAVQIENEYGSYGEDKEYVRWLMTLLRNVGVVEFLFTSDGPDLLDRGHATGIYATVNFNDNTDSALDALESFQPNKPLMTAEFWPGWFDHWGKRHHAMLPDDTIRRLGPIFERGASINFYMFHGGTNFGFMNGANLDFKDGKGSIFNAVMGRLRNILSLPSVQYAMYLPTVTSYDYDAPISEHGGKTEKYEKVKEMIMKYERKEDKTGRTEIDPWPTSPKQTSYGDVSVREWLTLTDALEHLPALPIQLQRPMFVETVSAEGVGQLYYGFVVYRAQIGWERVRKIVVEGVLADRMMVVIDGKTVATIMSDYAYAPIREEIVVPPSEKPETKGGRDLILLVENMGRANYARFPHTLDKMYKGFNGSVVLDSAGEPINVNSWKVHSVRFKTPVELQKLVLAATARGQWKSMDQADSVHQPAFYKGQFDVKDTKADHPDDTFVNMKEWTKGVVYANGENLGRYWNVGPPNTLYLPGPWLKKGGQNELVIFELHKPANLVKLEGEASLGEPCPLPCY